MISRSPVIVDTGFLVALVDRRDRYHSWAKQQLSDVSTPLLTCEAVITETCFLLQRVSGGEAAIFGFLNRSLIQIDFQLSQHSNGIDQLMQQYQNVPMSVADACLVKMSELIADSVVFTLDSDFLIYRRNRNELIPIVMP